MTTKAFAAQTPTDSLTIFELNRRDVGSNDIHIDIKYCGVCHSDIHMARNDWGTSAYPLVPGHEIVGRVISVGENVSNFKEGQLVGVGCMVDSCQECHSCSEGLEQYCEVGSTLTYSSPDPIMGGFTYGGYSGDVVVDQKFVLDVPESLDVTAVAPLLCAGITSYSPLRHWNIKKGDKVGVIGLGGLGHMGVKFAAAMGAHVVMITTSEGKRADAQKLGAHEVLISSNKKQMRKAANSFDFLLNTIPVRHDVNPYIALMKRDTTMAIVGVLGTLPKVDSTALILKRKRIAGSLIGGIKETQEMLNFCAEHNIVSDVEIIAMSEINQAYERVLKGDIKYRFVIDMDTL